MVISMVKRKRQSSYSVMILAGLLLFNKAYSLEPIPKESGVAGFVNLGASVVNVESNLLAETPFGDLGDKSLSSLNGSADGKTSVLPGVGFELSYTWADSRTQVFLGNSLEDFLRFDFSTRAGVRQEFEKVGVLGVSVIQSSLDTKVWKDPYDTHSVRSDTRRTSKGVRITWDKVFGTELELRYSAKDIDVDDEEIGSGLGWSKAERALLDRNGTTRRADVSYLFNMGDAGILVPRVSYLNHDRDGGAMSNDGVSLDVSYSLTRGRITYLANAMVGQFDYEDANPVYHEEDNATRLGLTFNIYLQDVFGFKGWVGNAGLAYFDESHDLDFYDTKAAMFNLGVLYRF